MMPLKVKPQLTERALPGQHRLNRLQATRRLVAPPPLQSAVIWIVDVVFVGSKALVGVKLGLHLLLRIAR